MLRDAVLCIVILFAASAAAGQTPAAPPGDCTIMTYNINFGNVDLGAVSQAIRASGADVVALQETNRQSEAFLRRTLANVYPHMVFQNVGDAAGGFAMLSKVPLENPRYAPPARETGGVFGVQTARVAFVGREVLIVNIHLMPTPAPRGTGMAALAVLYVKSDAIRLKEARAIVEGLPKRWPAIVLGDFNSPPQYSGVPLLMTASGFADCMAAVLKDANATPTWHWNYNGMDYAMRLDYIFSARLGVAPASGSVTPGGASDHCPVTCAFKNAPLAVTLGKVRAETFNVVYVVDAAGPALELVTASVAALTDAQNFSIIVPGAAAVPLELTPATDAARALAAEALKKTPDARADALLAAVKKAAEMLKDEAAPKTLFILSDRAANDPALSKTLREMPLDPKLRLVLLYASGNPAMIR